MAQEPPPTPLAPPLQHVPQSTRDAQCNSDSGMHAVVCVVGVNVLAVAVGCAAGACHGCLEASCAAADCLG